jgi:hypothetical protein
LLPTVTNLTLRQEDAKTVRHLSGGQGTQDIDVQQDHCREPAFANLPGPTLYLCNDLGDRYGCHASSRKPFRGKCDVDALAPNGGRMATARKTLVESERIVRTAANSSDFNHE